MHFDKKQIAARLELSSPSTRWLLAIIGAEIIIGILAQLWVPLNGDITIHINAAQRIMRGEELYRDIITANFPMQFYFRIPGVWLAQLLNVDPIDTAIVINNLVAVFTSVLMIHMLGKLPIGDTVQRKYFLIAVFIFAFIIYPGATVIIGQKEYLFCLFSLPYFTLAAVGSQNIRFSRAFRLFIGATSAIGFCYKPFCIFPLFMVEAYICYINRTWRTLFRAELLICGALGVAYLAWMLLALPEYLITIFPIAGFYYEMRPEIYVVVTTYIARLVPFIVPVCIVGLCMIMQARQQRNGMERFCIIFLLTFLGYICDGVIQMKTFPHHLYPTLALSIIFVGFGCIYTAIPSQSQWNIRSLIPRLPFNLSVFSLALGLVLGMFAVLSYVNSIPAPSNNPPEDALNLAFEDFQREEGHAAQTVYKFGYRIAPIFPQAIYRGIPWDYHFYHLWPLDGIINYRLRNSDQTPEWLDERTKKAETYIRELVTEDIVRLKPDILLVDRLGSINFIRYFSDYDKFAELMKEYQFSENYKGTDIFLRHADQSKPAEKDKKE